MPLISHEIPKALFPRHDEVSDYPYVLGHLLNLDTEYADFYKEKLKTAEYKIKPGLYKFTWSISAI